MARRRMDGSVRSSQERTAAQIRAERAAKKTKMEEKKRLLKGANVSIRDAVRDINTMIAQGASRARIRAAEQRLAGLRETAQMHADELKKLR